MSIKLGNDRDMSYTYRQSRDTVIRGNTLVTTKEVPYFTISSDETFTTEMLQKRWNGTLYYSTDKREWIEWDGSEIEGTKIYFRGVDNTTFHGNTRANDTVWSIQGSGIKLSGSLETILDYMQVYNDEHPVMDAGCFQYLFGTGAESGTTITNPGIVEIEEGLLPATTLVSRCYSSMFRGCTGLTSIPTDLLPATTLANACYQAMFQGCTSLINVPDLPAITLASECYGNMFSGCTSLTSIPSRLLPALELSTGCYTSMFGSCTSLTSIPSNLLPATKLKVSCYEGMFSGCNSLTTISSDLLPATTLAASCYNDMFRNCTSLTTVPNLPATTLANACYAEMFDGCTSLTTVRSLSALELKPECYKNMYSTVVLSTSQDSTYCNEYRVPSEGTGIEKPLPADEFKRALYYMFIDTNGNPFTPVINTTYYTNATVV